MAIAGYGRFGSAFAEVLSAAGLRVRAWDPEAEVPDRFRANDLRALTDGAAVVVIATPIGAMAGVIGLLPPLLDHRQVVIDVGSVKQLPAATMRATLGKRIPWVATHPLFGPMNIARGDRKLRAVVCPNDLHPDAVDTAQALYERIGCDVIRQRPDEHDRVMARTHAMAFFIAKGLIEIGAGENLPFTPPSFQALAQTIETVREDAGHLFLAIQRDNPEAAGARKALLDALSLAHDQIALSATGGPEAPTAAQLGIATPEDTLELSETRDLIDELDREIVGLLERRTHLAGRAGSIKAQRNRPVRDPEREQKLLGDRRAWAAEVGLPEDAIGDVFESILRLSRATQT